MEVMSCSERLVKPTAQCRQRSALALCHPGVLQTVCVALFLLGASGRVSADEIPKSDAARNEVASKFLATYCMACHSKDVAEGDREFQSLRFPFRTETQLISVDEIIDQLTLKEMPPQDSDQPTDAERLAMVGVLRAGIKDARDSLASTGGRTVLRRLSRREYENTLAVLFDRRVDTLGLTADFPKENTVQHMDNIGDALVTSGFLVDQYFQAANRLVDARLGKERMEPKTWHFTDNFRQYEELAGPHRNVFKYEFLALYEQPNTDTRQGGYGHIQDFLGGVPVSGLYDIHVHAQAMHRDTHYDPEIFRIDFSEPFQLAVVPGDATKGHIHYPQAIEPILASAIVPDEKPEWLKFRVWLEVGQTPRFIFPNGPYESRASVLEVNKRYRDEFEGKGFQDGVNRAHILRHGALPHIKIGEIKVHGPVGEPDGPKEELAVFGIGGFVAEKALDQLYAFASRAFRRPLIDSDRARIRMMYEQRQSEGATPRDAALDSLKLILCSPSFIYLSEITSDGEKYLRSHDLASRLSYALWAGPPDSQLRLAADSGSLTENTKLKKQIDRLLNSERSSEFVKAFLDSWLNLRDIGNLPPPRSSNRDYYAQNLPASMKEEARLFFQQLLQNNGPVTDFLEADYTYVDKKLAKLYRLPEQETLRLADGFKRVSIGSNMQRGGVLGMAGVLTVSANGVDTSPVTRGVWVSERLLGITPPPPPDEVPAIEADVSGAKSIREKLEKHRQDQACNVCHRKIDPFGFALETFDPIGRWRTKYPKFKGKRLTIDPSGKLTSGESYSDFANFKTVLSKTRRDIFTRNLIKQLLTYATGRRMERVDQFEIDDILARVKSDNYGLRTMLTEVLTSEIFRSP
jgi:hypothetical protein